MSLKKIIAAIIFIKIAIVTSQYVPTIEIAWVTAILLLQSICLPLKLSLSMWRRLLLWLF